MKLRISKGAIYRLGIRVKNLGEKLGHIRLFGFHIFSLLCAPVINLGYALRDSVRGCTIGEME